MMLGGFLRYPSVFKKNVRGKMFFFFRNLKLCPREILLKCSLKELYFGSDKLPFWGIYKNFKSSIRLPVTVSTTLSPGIFIQNDPTTS